MGRKGVNEEKNFSASVSVGYFPLLKSKNSTMEWGLRAEMIGRSETNCGDLGDAMLSL